MITLRLVQLTIFFIYRIQVYYIIYNTNIDMYYYGQSTYLVHRFRNHFRNLNQQTNDNRLLQEHFRENTQHFQFLVLDYEPE